jgi:alpha-glucosidase
MEELKDPRIPADKVDVSVTDIVEAEVIQHLNNPVVGLKPIVKKYLGEVQKVIQDIDKYSKLPR